VSTKWVYCEMCERLVKHRFHFFMHMIAYSLALKIERAALDLRRRQP